MPQLALIKIRMDFNGKKLEEPEIIEVISNKSNAEDHLNKLANIYARMFYRERELMNEKNLISRKSERKSC